MRRLILSLILASVALTAKAQTGPAQGSCTNGGVKVTTQGANSTTTVNASYPRCLVYVYDAGTTNLSTITKLDDSPLTNPFTANTDGSWAFKAAFSAYYDVTMTGGTPNAFPSPKTLPSIFIPNPTGGGGGSNPFGFLQINASNAAGNAFQGSNIFVNASAQNNYATFTNSTVNINSQFTTELRNYNHLNPLIGYTPGTQLNFDGWLGVCTNAIPGWDSGTQAAGKASFSQTNCHQVAQFNFGRQLNGAVSVTGEDSSVSDMHSLNVDARVVGGCVGNSDECKQIGRWTMTGGYGAYAGSINSLTSAQQLHINCIYDCPHPGVGRYLRKWPGGDVATNKYIGSVEPNSGTIATVHIATAVNGVAQTGIPSQYVSNFEGKIVANSPVLPEPTIYDLQAVPEAPFQTSVQFYVQTTGALGSPVVSDPINGPFMFPADSYDDSITVTAVLDMGGGKFKITGLAAWPQGVSANSYIYQGKAKMGYDLVLNRENYFEETQLPHSFECFGALDTYTLRCGQYLQGLVKYSGLGNATADAITIPFFAGMSNTAGTVTIGNFGGDQSPNGFSAVYFSGATPSAYNGLCTAPHVANGNLTCTQASSTGAGAVTVLPTMHLGTTDVGTAVGDIYSFAMVTDVRNPATHAVDGSFSLEPNSVFLGANGASVILEEGQNTIYTGLRILTDIGTTYHREDRVGIDLYAYHYAAYCGSGAPSGNGCNALITGTNTLFFDHTQLIGFGGIQYPMDFIHLNGVYGSWMFSDIAPYPSGANAFFIGCPLTGCDDSSYTYELFTLRQNAPGYAGILQYKPSTGELNSSSILWNFEGGRIKIGGLNPCLSDGTNCFLPSFTGLVKWTGTAWGTPLYSDVTTLFNGGTCSGFLNSAGTCTQPDASLLTGTTLAAGVTGAPGLNSLPALVTASALTAAAGGTFNVLAFQAPGITLTCSGGTPTLHPTASVNGIITAATCIP